MQTSITVYPLITLFSSNNGMHTCLGIILKIKECAISLVKYNITNC